MEAYDITNKRIAVLAGGWSDEREISLISGNACKNALLDAGFYKVDLLDIAEPDFVNRMIGGGYDVAFVAMHGRYGEDGSIQGLLEILHVPYTFSHVLASAMGTAKDVAKVMYRSAGIPTPQDVRIEQGQEVSQAKIDEMVDQLGLPLFVKPATNGSSYGITRVTQKDQLRDAIDVAGREGDNVLVEQCIVGTEITVPVLGNDDPTALPIVEIVMGEGADFYDLKVKYEPSELHHIIPARLDEDVYALAQELAVKAHKALGCRGVSRSDFIITAEGKPYILETNTIPGMTETSLLPDSARHAGIEFPQLCRKIVELALEEC